MVQVVGTETPPIMSASTMIGDKVVNPLREDLGDIEELMVDVGSGCIAYAVLSFGGFLGMGEKLFAIPWKALRLDTDRKRFVLDIDKQRLEDAPGFDKNNWPDLGSRDYGRQIHAYYGLQPYWEQ